MAFCLPREGGRIHVDPGWVVGEMRNLEMGTEEKNVAHLNLGSQIDLVGSNMIRKRQSKRE